MNVDLVIATYNRSAQLRRTLQNVLAYGTGLGVIYVVDNGSSDDTRQIIREAVAKDGRICAIHNETNLGAAAGKNVGLRRSSADIVIVIDDDAEFCTADPVASIRRAFEREPKLAVVQFKIINHSTGRVLGLEFPGRDVTREAEDTFLIGYFIGAGHAIRKAALDEVGYYPDDFGPYAHEEVDLSYRTVAHGYQMRYLPEVAVHHMKDPRGRISRSDVLYWMLYNRLTMTWKYLPLRYALVNNVLWTLKTMRDSRSFAVPVRAWRDHLRARKALVPEPLPPQALRYLRRHNGRLYK
jgi:GT2 family glycosyltransferase